MTAFHLCREMAFSISIEFSDRGEAELKPIYKYFNIIKTALEQSIWAAL